MCSLLVLGFLIHLGFEAQAQRQDYLFNDSHFHLTNYIQEGLGIKDFLNLIGEDVGRVALFGIPLQQTWSYGNSGDFAPTYYLESDAPLYYYSFTDAHIALEYLSLSEKEKKRFDPMITGFNPSDMYAADHIKRVLLAFPGVFTGIGEFTIHKEFVSPKVAGETASLTNPALDRIMETCAETGLLVIIHNDIDIPFQKEGREAVYYRQMVDMVSRHPNTTIIWAHTGLGRVVHPVRDSRGIMRPVRYPNQMELIEETLSNPAYQNLYFDISWDEVAKYIISTPENIEGTARLINKFPDRILFGTDVVAPKDKEMYMGVYRMYEPLWDKLFPETREKVLKGNYERLFDQSAKKVRAWEEANKN
ncbi:amidohydrolase family protein [Aquiflexum gelatinilyticum]|uniref:amidohydrolase family protein n=1 Tax=Aquiflexum gelatinilyticum TaxID=2961943 RepID=UPI00216A94A8|nr:amidohydrolase [Aquiflexum gelatinilyticum]MCS4434201.1 amidohydrolase [Aquiflexum gelatinilyticum]